MNFLLELQESHHPCFGFKPLFQNDYPFPDYQLWVQGRSQNHQTPWKPGNCARELPGSTWDSGGARGPLLREGPVRFPFMGLAGQPNRRLDPLTSKNLFINGIRFTLCAANYPSKAVKINKELRFNCLIMTGRSKMPSWVIELTFKLVQSKKIPLNITPHY